MSDEKIVYKKISQLDETPEIYGPESAPIAQNGKTFRVTFDTVINWLLRLVGVVTAVNTIADLQSMPVRFKKSVQVLEDGVGGFFKYAANGSPDGVNVFAASDGGVWARTIGEAYSRKEVDERISDAVIKSQAEYIKVTGTALPTPSSKVWTWLFGGPEGRTYTHAGGDITVGADKMTIGYFDGTTWSESGEEGLPQVEGSETLEPDLVPKGRAVVKYIAPLFAITDPLIADEDVSTIASAGSILATGSLDLTQESCDLSEVIPVKVGDIIHYKGSLSTALLAVAGYKSSTTNPTNFVKSLLNGGIYTDIQSIVIEDPTIKFVRASSRNANYPNNTNRLYVHKITSKLAVIENEISSLSDTVSQIELNMIDPYVNEDVTPTKVNNRVIATTNGNTADLTSSGFPDTEYCDYTVIEEGVDYYVSGWFGNSNGIAGYDASKVFNSRLADTSNNSINKIEYADDYKLIIPSTVKFIRGGSKDRNLYPFIVRKKQRIEQVVQDVSDKITTLENKGVSKIVIKQVSATAFNVNVYDVNRKDVVTHSFIRDRRVNNVGVVTDMITEDIWYPNSIIVNGNTIAQGNLNFIYMIDTTSYSNENGHVGAGHGCVVAKWTQFLADGKPFDPTSTFEDIICSTFSISFYADCYAIDKSISASSENALPKLDESNNPILATNHALDATYYLDGRIEHRNRLHIRRDNTKFSQCHAAMNSCFRPYFDKVIFPNITEYTINQHYVEGGNVVVNAIDGSSINTGTVTRYYSNEVTQIGSESYKYKLKNTITNMDNTKQSKANLYFYYGSSPNWLKVYLQPVVCTSNPSFSSAAAEVFNNGDIIDVLVKREVIVE